MGKREAEINITGNSDDAKASIKDLEDSTKKSFDRMSDEAEKNAKEVSDAFKKSGIRMEKDIKKTSEDARKRYRKIKDSGTASANDIKRAHNSMTATIKKNNREMSTSTKGMQKIIDNIKRSLIVASAAAVGFFGVNALTESIKFEAALLDLQKVLNDTEGDAKQYTGQIEDLAKTYGDASTEILQGVAVFKQAGFTISESFLLQESAMKLAASSELEVAEAAELVKRSLKGFKAPVSDVVRLTDVLNETSNNYSTNLKELAIGMADISPIAKKMGFSFEETVGLLTPIIEVFGSGSEAAQALKTGLLKLIDDAVPVADALEAMGINQKEFNEGMEDGVKVMRSGRDIYFDVAKRFETLADNQKLVSTAQITGIRQAAKMVEIFDGLALSTEISNKALKSTGSINKETAIRLSATEVKGKRAAQSFNIMAKALGDGLLPVWNALLDVAIPSMDAITVGIKGMAKAIQFVSGVGITKFLINPFGVFGKTLDEVNKEAKGLNKTNKEGVAVNEEQVESIEKVTEALIDVEGIRKKEKATIEDNRDTAIAAINSVMDLQRVQNESIKDAIRETKAELRELEAEAERAAKFSKRILDEIAGSEKRREQVGFDPLELLVDDLRRAEADFKQASKERAAGNVDAARELTLSAVQAANAILEVKKGAEVESEVTTGQLNRATTEAERLVGAAKRFATEMQTAAQDAIPEVEKQLSTLDSQLEQGKATLKGLKAEISAAQAEAKQLKDLLSQDTTATHTQIINTVNTGGNGGPGFNTGGAIPGYGGGDKYPIMAEGGEHVIKKESVKKLGRPAAVAFNNGDIAGLINALPMQHLKEGGEVHSEGSTNVNLIMGEKSFPMTATTSVAEEFVNDIKSINVVRSRKKNIY
jgi:TP901 family phage tail tape measure protein